MRTPSQVIAALLTLPLLTNCTNNTSGDKATGTTLASQASGSQMASHYPDSIKDDEAFEVLVQILNRKAKSYWGDDRHAGRMEYVKYTNNYQTRVFINFEQGRIHIETQDRKDLRHAIISTLLTPYNPENVDLFTDQDIPLGKEPMLYGQVLDHDQKPIRWQWRASRFTDYLIKNEVKEKPSAKGTIYHVELDLVSNHTLQRQYHYAGVIRLYGHQYDIDESLIYAIIRTESHFNPYAISSSRAYGLMQIIPHTAGRDVFARIKNRADQPSKEYLFQPHYNIETGTAYLHLLETHYLKDIEDPTARKYAVISAYNGGTGNVLATFDNNRKRAISKINDLEPNEVYQALTNHHPRAESRRYLEKVTAAQRDFYQQYVLL